MSTRTLLKEAYCNQPDYQPMSAICCHAAVLITVHTRQAFISRSPHLFSAVWCLCDLKQQRHKTQADQALLHAVQVHRPLPVYEKELEHSQGSRPGFRCALLVHAHDTHGCILMEDEPFQEGVVERGVQPIGLIHLPLQQLVHKVERQLCNGALLLSVSLQPGNMQVEEERAWTLIAS